MSERLNKLLQIAKETKDALYLEWKKKQYFEDCNNFFDAGRGIMSDAMGLTSVMLMYVCFAENPKVYSAGVNDEDTRTIVTKSIDYIYESVKKDGYTVAPLRSVEDTMGVIDKEHAYVDTLTWVLSSSILTVYAIRQKLIELDESYETKAIELIADSFAHLNAGQLSSGAWGFSTDSKQGNSAKPSLYFTYAVAASLGDLLDYIFGELEYYSNDANQEKSIEDFYDWKTVDAINSYYRENPKDIYPTDNITETVAKMRGALQNWLLENCLPVLPKLAECIPLSDDEMERIGMVRQTSADKISKLGGKDYINLYYAYYVIDILTTSSSDKRYSAIAEGRDVYGKTLDDLKLIYKRVMSESDYDYFFEKNGGSNASSLFIDYINQAIHSARTSLGTARRSGKAFWDSSASELIIPWEHEKISRQRIDEARGDVEITEPALIPMALRANTVYCFYVIERSDITVDNMFDLICEDRSPKTETVRRDSRVKHLWDCVNYSLPITERAIESLVDYSDYISKTALNESNMASSGEVLTVDAVIDQKIRQYLLSEDGLKTIESLGFVRGAGTVDMSAVENMVESRINSMLEEKCKNIQSERRNTSVTNSVDAFNPDELIAQIENVERYIMSHEELPDRDSSDYCERLAYAFLELHKLLNIKSIQDAINGCILDESERQKILASLKRQLEELVDLIANHCSNANGNLAGIYRKLIVL